MNAYFKSDELEYVLYIRSLFANRKVDEYFYCNDDKLRRVRRALYGKFYKWYIENYKYGNDLKLKKAADDIFNIYSDDTFGHGKKIELDSKDYESCSSLSKCEIEKDVSDDDGNAEDKFSLNEKVNKSEDVEINNDN